MPIGIILEILEAGFNAMAEWIWIFATNDAVLTFSAVFFGAFLGQYIHHRWKGAFTLEDLRHRDRRLGDVLQAFKDEIAQLAEQAERVVQAHETGRPVVVGTIDLRRWRAQKSAYLDLEYRLGPKNRLTKTFELGEKFNHQFTRQTDSDTLREIPESHREAMVKPEGSKKDEALLVVSKLLEGWAEDLLDEWEENVTPQDRRPPDRLEKLLLSLAKPPADTPRRRTL